MAATLLNKHRDTAAAKRLFSRAIERHGTPQSITLDCYPASHAAVAELKKGGLPRQETKVWTSKYLNNLIEQDQRRVEQRVYPMLGFKRFVNAAVTISGVELVHRIRKGQFDTSSINQSGVREPQTWELV
jgi:transposase-like protein